MRTLADFFERERREGRALVAAFIIGTEGSTYRKCGALMLFSAGAERFGLLSGGCLGAICKIMRCDYSRVASAVRYAATTVVARTTRCGV